MIVKINWLGINKRLLWMILLLGVTPPACKDPNSNPPIKNSTQDLTPLSNLDTSDAVLIDISNEVLWSFELEGLTLASKVSPSPQDSQIIIDTILIAKINDDTPLLFLPFADKSDDTIKLYIAKEPNHLLGLGKNSRTTGQNQNQSNNPTPDNSTEPQTDPTSDTTTKSTTDSPATTTTTTTTTSRPPSASPEPDKIDLKVLENLEKVLGSEVYVVDPNTGKRLLKSPKEFKPLQALHFMSGRAVDAYLAGELTPKQLWEQFHRWPFPSDHLPASTVVSLQGSDGKVHELSILTTNLLNPIFADNRLANQGLENLLAERFLDPIEIESEGRKRPGFKPNKTLSKSWALNQVRQDAQKAFLEGVLKSQSRDLIGLQEVSDEMLAVLNILASQYNYEMVVTRTVAEQKDLVDGSKAPSQDYGVMLINKGKFEVSEPTDRSFYKFSRGREKPDKHMTAQVLVHKESGLKINFVNTHTTFGSEDNPNQGLAELAEFVAQERKSHPDATVILTGDFNSELDTRSEIFDAAMPDSARFHGQNQPGHISFDPAHPKQVRPYDGVHAIGPNIAGINEAKDANALMVEYSKKFKSEVGTILTGDKARKPNEAGSDPNR